MGPIPERSPTMRQRRDSNLNHQKDFEQFIMGGRRASAQWNINANLERRSLNSKFNTMESPTRIAEKSPVG